MNIFIHIGRLVADPELKVTPSGKTVVSFRCAIHRPFTKNKTDFFDYRAWDGTAERIARNFRKGSVIALKGHEEQDRWQDSDNTWRSRNIHVVDEFDFCGKNLTASNDTIPQYEPDGEGFEDLTDDDELPFG